MIVLVESLGQTRTSRQPQVTAPECGTRWGKTAEYNFGRTDAEEENEARGGINTVERSQNPVSVKLWNLSPVWRTYDLVEIVSSENPDLKTQATVTREMLIPVGSSTEKYVGGGIGYVEDPGDYGYEERTIHTFVRLSLPSPVPDAEVIDTGEEGAWPDYPLEAHPPGRFTPAAPVPGPWTK